MSAAVPWPKVGKNSSRLSARPRNLTPAASQTLNQTSSLFTRTPSMSNNTARGDIAEGYVTGMADDFKLCPRCGKPLITRPHHGKDRKLCEAEGCGFVHWG